jgi:hypothetical protein
MGLHFGELGKTVRCLDCRSIQRAWRVSFSVAQGFWAAKWRQRVSGVEAANRTVGRGDRAGYSGMMPGAAG